MIQFTRYSKVVLRPDLETDYPFCTYNLLPFEDIPNPGGPPVRFLDVIGRITAVSDVVPIVSMHQAEPSNTRTILLVNLQGQELKLVLWGNRALEFEEEAVRARNEKAAVIAIFVGMLPKMNQGVKGLSCSSACRWYINEDLPVINDFRKRLGTDFKPIDAAATSNIGALPTRVYADPIEMNVSELLRLDPFENEEKMFICTATVQRLNSTQRWWFFSCSVCNKTSTLIGSQFRCSNPACNTIKAYPTYCVSLFASDDTAEAEFMLFDKVEKEAVGKHLFTLLRLRNPGHSTIEEIARVPMVDRIAPPEVTRIVGQKYKILVSISKRSFAASREQLSFQVVRIMESFKPELSSSAFDNAPTTSGPSSSTSLPGAHSNFKNCWWSPCNSIARQNAVSKTKRQAGPVPEHSAKTNLPKEPKAGVEDKPTCDDKPEPSSVGAEEKDDNDDPIGHTKNKRNSNAGKGNSAATKSRHRLLGSTCGD